MRTAAKWIKRSALLTVCMALVATRSASSQPSRSLTADQTLARTELVTSGIPATIGEFNKAIGNGDLQTIELFFKAGFSPNTILPGGSGFVLQNVIRFNKGRFVDAINLFRRYGLDWLAEDPRPLQAFIGAVCQATGHIATQQDELIDDASRIEPKFLDTIISLGADPKPLLANIKILREKNKFSEMSDYFKQDVIRLEARFPDLAALQAAPPTISQFEFRGIHLGMTLPQVMQAAAAEHMTVRKFTVSNRPGEIAVDIRDPSAAPEGATSSDMMNRMYEGLAARSNRSGLKMAAYFSSADGKVMTIIARNAGLDGTETANGGQLFQTAFDKFGRPQSTGRGQIWGAEKGPHMTWREESYGQNEILDDLNDSGHTRYELVISDPTGQANNMSNMVRPQAPAPRL